MSKRQSLTAAQNERRSEQRGAAFTVGSISLMFLALVGGKVVDGMYEYKNDKALERTLAADGLSLEGHIGRGNGFIVHGETSSMRVGLGSCLMTDVVADITRGANNAIVDTSHYKLDVVSNVVERDKIDKLQQPTATTQTIVFESAADLQQQLGGDPCALLQLPTTAR